MKLNVASEIKSFEFNASSTYIYYSIHKLSENSIATTTSLNATTGTWRLSGAVPAQTHQVFNFNPHLFTREIGFKQYELTDHLGNVRVVVSDIKEPENIANLTLGYHPSVLSSNDYFPFGMIMPGRNFNSNSYNFGFNGMEKDDEWRGITGADYDLSDYGLDVLIGRRKRPDPKGALFPSSSPYAFAANSSTNAIDPDGEVVIFINGNHYGEGGSKEYRSRKEVFHYNPYRSVEKEYAFDKEVMKQFGDNNARYYDGGLGGYAPFNFNNNTQPFRRYMTGYLTAKTDAADIIANLKRDENGKVVETIKITSHSMGGVYAKGFVQALKDHILDNNIEGVIIEIEVDFSSFQSNDPLNKAVDGVPTYQASHSDDGVAGNKPAKGAAQVDTGSDKKQGHSVFDYKNTVKKLGGLLKGVRKDKN